MEDGAKVLQIHTDGSCLKNPGPGGWAAIITDNGSTRELSGGHPHTTNNRMEMLAVLNGLKALPHSVNVAVFSDSEYVVNTMTRNWKRRKNLDIWEDLDAEAAKRNVDWQWIRGHSGHPLNERADRLAQTEARKHDGAPPRKKRLTHVDESGAARMVDVGAKTVTERVAVARGAVTMKPETLALIRSNALGKGDALAVARVAGVMAAKNTAQLIPLCHPIPLDVVTVDFETDEDAGRVNVEAAAKTSARTGVEMEALTAVSVAALTIYDMCKAADRSMRIESVRLVKKTGGRSGSVALEE